MTGRELNRSLTSCALGNIAGKTPLTAGELRSLAAKVHHEGPGDWVFLYRPDLKLHERDNADRAAARLYGERTGGSPEPPSA